MSKILFIGPYREFSSFGSASRGYIKALAKNHNISIRPIYNNIKPYKEISEELVSLENISYDYDVLIQHCYPHQFVYRSGYKNIGIVSLDSANYHADMAQHINILDEVWVPSSHTKEILKNISVTKPIRVVPVPVDLNKIQEYKTNNKKIKNNNYTFYIIDDYSDKNNIKSIISSFIILCIEFSNIELVIKTKNKNNDSSKLKEIIEYDILNLLKISPLNNDIIKPKILVGEMQYDNMLYIHNNSDCYINLASGDNFGISTLESIAFNNQIICTRNITSSEFAIKTKGFMVDSFESICLDNNKTFSIYNTIYQKWQDPILENLIIQMRNCVNESFTEKQSRIDLQNNIIQEYSMDSVASLLINL